MWEVGDSTKAAAHLVVGRQTLLERLGVVVGPLDERLAGDVVGHVLLGRVDCGGGRPQSLAVGASARSPPGLTLAVVAPARGGVDETASDARNKEPVRHLELERLVELLLLGREHAVEFFCLNDRAGEAVEDEAAPRADELPRPLRAARRTTHPLLHSLLVSSWSLIMPIMISSLTSPPASIIFLASLPRAVCCATWVRSMSPVARWQTQYFFWRLGAWVPLPGEGRRRQRGWRGRDDRPLAYQHREGLQ